LLHVHTCWVQNKAAKSEKQGTQIFNRLSTRLAPRNLEINYVFRQCQSEMPIVRRYNQAMSSFAWLIILVLLLTLVGSATLVFITVKYYWGERGTPPLVGEERRRQREAELKLRAKQFEHSAQHPRETRSESFLDNRKRGA
jgi:hypothetical protein